MADFIASLAASFNVTGLAPRAIALFHQVRSVSNFRWGNKSRSIAAACLAIALRESNRPDALRDIASVLDVPATSVTREFTHITTSLGLSLTLIDPSAYMPTLQAHISSSLTDLPSHYPNHWENLNLHSVNETAVSLSRLLARLSPGHDVLRLPVPPTACAIFMLALEGDLRAPLNPLGDMANCLGARLQVAKMS
jgi:transcription factor IIIB subunit 2